MAKKRKVKYKPKARYSAYIYGDDIYLNICDKHIMQELLISEYNYAYEIRENVRGLSVRTQPSSGGYDYHIWMPSFDWTIEDQSILAHEIIHAATGVLVTRGVDISEGVSEALAYLYQDIFRCFWGVLKPKKKKHG